VQRIAREMGPFEPADGTIAGPSRRAEVPLSHARDFASKPHRSREMIDDGRAAFAVKGHLSWGGHAFRPLSPSLPGQGFSFDLLEFEGWRLAWYGVASPKQGSMVM
jgi:hypothetical protein